MSASICSYSKSVISTLGVCSSTVLQLTTQDMIKIITIYLTIDMTITRSLTKKCNQNSICCCGVQDPTIKDISRDWHT